MHTNNGGINPQASRCERAQEEDDIKSIEEELLLVPAHPALEAVVDAFGLARARVEFFLGQHGVFLAVVADHEDGWESVGEL